MTAVILGPLAGVAVLTLGCTVRVTSDSMAPTLRPGDRVLLDRWTSGEPAIGDLVVFHEPGTDGLAVKRVVGGGGDTIELADGRLRRNGRLVEEPYTDPGRIDSVYFGPVHIPDGTSFVMGDNRATSIDSRSYGPVPHSRIVARVVIRLWPPRP